MVQAGLSKTCRQVPAHHGYATLSRTMGNRAAFLRRPRNTDSFDQFRLRFAARHAYFALAKKKGAPLPQPPRRNRPRLRRFPPSPPETPRTGCGRTWPLETPQGRRRRWSASLGDGGLGAALIRGARLPSRAGRVLEVPAPADRVDAPAAGAAWDPRSRHRLAFRRVPLVLSTCRGGHARRCRLGLRATGVTRKCL